MALSIGAADVAPGAPGDDLLADAEIQAEEDFKAACLMWMNSDDLGASAADAFLAGLGIDLAKLPGGPPRRLRSYRAALYRKLGRPGRCVFPLMLAYLGDAEDRPVGVHATWLDADGAGLANVPVQRMIFGAPVGGACRLYPAEAQLGLTQTPEAALAIRAVTGMPVWATGGLGNLASIVLPPIVKSVVICAEHADTAFERAEIDRAAARLAGGRREVKVMRPPAEHRTFVDWMGGTG